MPAASEPTLPHTFRPLGVRIMIIGLGAMLLLVCVVTWFALPAEVRDQFSPEQRGTLVLFGLILYGAGFALARSRVVAREDGVTVVNGYRTHRYEWNEVLAVTLRPGSPWAVLDLADGTTVAAMGIQGSDGSRATSQVRQLRRLVDRLTR